MHSHNLANDNAFLKAKNKKKFETTYKVTNFEFPKVYKLFSFMPCVTTLEAVWSRKNYDEHKQVN